jgi:hypothetical protein
MAGSEKNFAAYYRMVIGEVAKSASAIYGKTHTVSNSEIFNNPALQDLKELMAKYLNYAGHSFQFFAEILETEISRKTEDDVEGLIEIALAKEDEMKAENFHTLEKEKVIESYQERLKKGQLVYKKLLIITRDIMQNVKMTKKAVLANRMQDSLMVATYMAAENYSAVKGKKIMPAEELFPDYKEAITSAKKLRMTQVVEISIVNDVVTELSAAQKIIKDMDAILFDPPKDKPAPLPPRMPLTEKFQQKPMELA